MNIILKKIDQSHHTLTIIKDGEIFDTISLDTKTYFLHDIVHYCVEQELKISDGFWGMIAKGYKLAQLGGKTNELTAELREVEKIVGAVQSVYSGHMPTAMFQEHTQLLQLNLPPDFLPNVVAEITAIINQWKYLPVGHALSFSFVL